MPLALVEAEVLLHLVYRPGAGIYSRTGKAACLEGIATAIDDMDGRQPVRFETITQTALSA